MSGNKRVRLSQGDIKYVVDTRHYARAASGGAQKKEKYDKN